MPPSPIRAFRRSVLSALPGGCELKSRTCAMVAAPTKPVLSLNCGQASMQQQHEMQLDSGYASSCISDDWRGPVPRSYRSEEHTSELQSLRHLVCRLLL